MNEVPCTYRISVKAIITDTDGRLLLLQEADGSWELPGGGLEHGEQPKVGLAREIAEETGMSVEWMSEQPVAFWTINKQVGSPSLTWFGFVAYKVKVSGEFRVDPTNDEAQDAQYFYHEEAQLLGLHDNTKPYFS